MKGWMHWSGGFAVLAAAISIASATPVFAQMISGTATVIDGDTLEIAGSRIRLFGIDAPEIDQTCDRDGETWDCGYAARTQLGDIIGTGRIDCQGQGTDQYGRILAVCSAGYTPLNAVMVETGWAIAFRKYSDAYVAQETRAKAERSGLWASSFVRPDDYRASRRKAETPIAAPRRSMPVQHASNGLCTIKGNRNRKGQWIYHMPGMPYYEATNPEELFCSEAAAQAAGYRRAIVRP